MRYQASEKAEIIHLVEQSHLPAKRTLDKLGIPRATFYRWYDRYREGGLEALADHRSRPDRVWNRIPDDVRRQIIDLALDLPELSPRELAVRFIDGTANFSSSGLNWRSRVSPSTWSSGESRQTRDGGPSCVTHSSAAVTSYLSGGRTPS